MDTQKPIPGSLPVEPSDLSFQVMPQEGNLDPARASSPVPSKPAGMTAVPPPIPDSMPPSSLGRSSPNLMYTEPEPSFFRSKWIYIAVGAIVLIALGLLAYVMLGSKMTSTTQPETVVTKLPKVWLQQYFAMEVCDDQSICGDDANPDNDGLSNYDEFKAGTSPVNPDADSDGIADGDEVSIYKTEPTFKYTDKRDTVAQNDWSDGFQIKNGYDPLTPGLKFTDVRKQQIADDTVKFSLHEPTVTTLKQSAPTTQTYSSPNGFEFQYPSTWKKIVETPASSTDYLPQNRNFTALYPSAFPAAVIDSRVDVYNQKLATVLTGNTSVKGGTKTQVTINGIIWTKSVKAASATIPASTDYLVENNGKTYHLAGNVDIVNQVVTTFKFGTTAAIPTPATPTPATPTPAAPAPKTVSVMIQNNIYAPSTVAINKGDKVVWTNKDAVPHTVTGDKGGPISASIPTNGTYTFTFNTAGTFVYHCTVHPAMTGSVVVK